MTLVIVNPRTAGPSGLLPGRGQITFERLDTKERFTVFFNGVQQMVALSPNISGTYWHALHKINMTEVNRYFLVPDSNTPLDYDSLVQVDPESYEPPDVDEKFWEQEIEELREDFDERVTYFETLVQGNQGIRYEQVIPASTWTFPIPASIGRFPNVGIYIGGELVEADVTATTQVVSVSFPSPRTGVLVLS